uniref:Uncharacterized protein n=1 Tax=Panagrolaimus sp. ES5 TaxID=591445 RepID=A0AC34F8M2_9BILA
MSDNYDINDSTLFDGFFDENTLFQEVYGDDENDYAAIEKDYGGVKEEKSEEHDETSDSTITPAMQPPHMMQQRPSMNPPHFQQQYVYYPNYQMQQPHQNLIYHPNLPIQRYPYQQQQVYFQQQMPPPSQGHHPSRQMTIQQQQQPSFLPLYQPYKIAQSFHAKLRDRQVTGEAALLEINRLQFQRWHKCVEYVKSYLSTSHELIPFIVYLLENSASSNVCIQWKERTKKFEHDRAFEFKSKEEIAKAYFVVTGKETKYTNIITKLTRLCNTRFDGCPVFQKTKSRNTYEIFPTLIPSHDDTPCPVQIVNGLPVETDYI